jgi:photosystem II stability/assembly factor-like uncharacterized protein
MSKSLHHILSLVLFCLISINVLFNASACLAGTNWQAIGPYGGVVNVIAIDPANSQTLYAGTNGGVSKSTNGGASWFSVQRSFSSTNGRTNSDVRAVAVAPTNSQTLYAGTFGGGIFKSGDGGVSWTEANNGLWTSAGVIMIRTIVIDPSDSNTIYAAGAENTLYKSTSGGASWTAILSGIPSGAQFLTLAVDPNNRQTVYAGTYQYGVYKTTNGGASWTAFNSGLTSSYVEFVAIDPADSRTVYAGTSGGGLFKSVNGGASWAASGNGINSPSVNSIAVDPAKNTTIYAGTPSKLYKSTDAGASWTNAFNGISDSTYVNYLVIDPGNSQTVYAGTGSAGVFKSVNGGGSWRPARTGITGLQIACLAGDPKNRQTLYAGASGGGLFKSVDGGVSWSEINTGAAQTHYFALIVDPTDSQTVYAGSYWGLFKSTDGGVSWVEMDNGLTSTFIRALAMPPGNGQTLYAGTANGVFKTTDGGTSWSAATSGISLSNTDQMSLVVDPTNPTTIYYATGNGGVFKSSNGGGSWSAINSGLSDLYIESLAIDPNNGQIVYAGAAGGLYKSNNGGASWATSSTGFPWGPNLISLAIDPSNSQTLYAGSYFYGIYRSGDGGASWASINNGLTYVSSIIIDPSDNRTVYAASYGVFKTLISAGVPAITGTTISAIFRESAPGMYKVAASGWPPPQFSISGSLPPGVSFDPISGALSGTPAAGSAGSYPLMETASNGIPPDATSGLTLTVLPATPLAVAITTPTSQANLNTLASITGTASGNGLSGVSVQVSDGVYYLQADGTFTTTPSWLSATGTTAWSLNTSTVAWREGLGYTILARAASGSTSSAPAPSTFTIQVPSSKTAAFLTMAITPSTLRAGESSTVSGQLVDANAHALTGQAVNLIITPPATITTPNPALVIIALSTDSNGNFTSGALSQFAVAGVYMVQVRFNGTLTLAASSTSQALGVTPQSGYAIIVTGEATDLSLLAMHTATTDAIYSTLVNKRGFLPANITYLQSTTSAAVTMQQVQNAITSWARDKIAAAPAPLYLFMVDHGSNTGFMLGGQTIAPSDLAGWLNTLESDPQVVTSGALSAYNRFIVIGSCYSGEFVSLLSKPGRVIITSAGADEQSLAGFSIYNSATGTSFSGGEYFIDNMINFLGRGDSIKDAVLQASSNVTLRDPRKVALGQHSGAYDTLAQHPLLDDNGDGIAGYLPAGGTDGALAANLSLGVGIKSLGEPADITGVTGTAIRQATQTGDVPLWLQVNDNSHVGKAWMEIRTPITSVSSSGGTGQVIPQLITQPLFFDGLQWNSSYSFPNAGTYKILYYTQDNQTGDISPTAHSTVYRQLAGNTAPSSFSLSSPPDQQGVSPMFPLTWQEVTSNNSVTYTLLVATDQNFGSIVYKEEGIPQATTYIADGKLKNPANNAYYCQNGDSYCYWKVQAIDSYGTVTESNFRSFTVVASNGLPALLKGYVRSSATGAPIAGAQVVTGSGTVSTLSNGFYLSSVFASSVSLSVSAPGYLPKTLSNVSTPAASVVSNDFNLSPSGVAGKPGDCDGNGTVTIAEVQSAINMFLGLKPVQLCVDLDNSGVVTISEVQKVIDSFLGL